MNAAAKSYLQSQARRPLVIGLVNNMGLTAMAAAQAQFKGLVCATGYPIKFVCFTMRQMQDGIGDHLPIHAITGYGVDAIIVTGMEITKSDIRDEWLWEEFTQLYDWAEQESIPGIWSCLAAHAAVLHRDGILRQPLGPKLSGVFPCNRAATSHKLTSGLPEQWQCPHSRYNGLSIPALESQGYTIVSHGSAVGADIFMHSANPGTFYFQGHPEYHSETLLHEFLRDLRRFIGGESSTCPAIPAAYFDDATEDTLVILRNEVLAGRDVLQAARTSVQQAIFRNDWRGTAIKLYSNWLDIVAEHAARRTGWCPVQNTATPIGEVRQ